MSINLPAIPTRQSRALIPQGDRARWRSELRRRAKEVERIDRAAFMRFRGRA